MCNARVLSAKLEVTTDAVLEVIADVEELHVKTYGEELKFMINENYVELPAFMVFVVSRIISKPHATLSNKVMPYIVIGDRPCSVPDMLSLITLMDRMG